MSFCEKSVSSVSQPVMLVADAAQANPSEELLRPARSAFITVAPVVPSDILVDTVLSASETAESAASLPSSSAVPQAAPEAARTSAAASAAFFWIFFMSWLLRETSLNRASTRKGTDRLMSGI